MQEIDELFERAKIRKQQEQVNRSRACELLLSVVLPVVQEFADVVQRRGIRSTIYNNVDNKYPNTKVQLKLGPPQGSSHLVEEINFIDETKASKAEITVRLTGASAPIGEEIPFELVTREKVKQLLLLNLSRALDRNIT